MQNTISMQDMRYLNLFEKITRVQTRYCFKYNEFIIFCVPRHLVSAAIGENGKNIKKLNEILRKKIKVITIPNGIYSAKQFIEAIISPVKFKDLNINDNEIIVTAGSQSKAALIGRNKRRLLEMQKIIRDYFSRDFRIV
jgi:NusA-like KH domain protein